jgi:hypothetical protein
MVYDADGKLTETRKRSNEFTCIPTITNLPDPDPMCMDAASHQWMKDMMSGAPKPTNTVPGVAYMARGGSHYEKDGKVVLGADGAKVVKEPPHWMIFGRSMQRAANFRLSPIRAASISCSKGHLTPIS